MNIGSMTVKDGGVGEVVGTGEIKTLDMAMRFDVIQARGMSGEDQPALVFMCKAGHGGTVEVGKAWRKPRKDADDFYSCTFDDPSWPQALNVAAFPVDGKPDGFAIVFSRPRQKAA